MLENVKKIHDASMKILSETGMKFHHPDAQKILRDHGIRMDGNRAFFTEEQVMKYVKMAPSICKIHAKNSTFDISVGGSNVYNGPSAGPTFVMDKNGNKREATLEDYIKLLKLYEQNPAYMINGGQACVPSDLDPSIESLALHYVALMHTDKTIWVGSGTYQEMEAVIDLTCAAFQIEKEDLQNGQYVINCVNTNSPLQFDKRMTETLFTFGKYKQPVIIAAAAMAGTTAPVTMAGTLAMVNAEVLATIALAEMNVEGCPVIYGSQTANADLSTCAIAIGSPEAALYYQYCAELAKYYNLPCRGGGALTDAKSLDVQAGYESMLTYYTCRNSKINIILQSAGILESYLSVSFEKLMVDFEIIDMVNRFFKDFAVDEETLPLELIKEVGPGGQFLMEEHTFEFCRLETFHPSISVRGPKANASHVYLDNIQKKMETMLNTYKKPKRDEKVVEKMQEILRREGIVEDTIQYLNQ